MRSGVGNVAMAGQGRLSHGMPSDPRLVNVHVERATKSIRATIVGSPVWVGFFAVMCSGPVAFLGQVPVLNALALILIVFVASGFAMVALRAFERSRKDNH